MEPMGVVERAYQGVSAMTQFSPAGMLTKSFSTTKRLTASFSFS